MQSCDLKIRSIVNCREADLRGKVSNALRIQGCTNKILVDDGIFVWFEGCDDANDDDCDYDDALANKSPN